MLLFAGMLASVGTALFVGEWVFGSLGWGALLGSQLAVAIAVAAGIRALEPKAPVGGPLVLALLLGAVVAVLLGLHLPNQAWDQLGTSVAPDLAPVTRPLVVGVVVVGAACALLGLIGGAAVGGVGAAIGLLVVGAILGAGIGAISAITFTRHVGVAVGLAVFLGLWPVFSAMGLFRHGVSSEALRARFWPEATIATTKETIEWARERMPLGRKS